MFIDKTQIECCSVILGYKQRAGLADSQDRILAIKLGAYGVEQALTGYYNIRVSEHNNHLFHYPIEISGQQKSLLMNIC